MIEEPVFLLIWSCPKILFTSWDVLGRTFFFSKVACGFFVSYGTLMGPAER